MNQIYFVVGGIAVDTKEISTFVIFEVTDEEGAVSFEDVFLMTNVHEFESYKEKDEFVLALYESASQYFEQFCPIADEIYYVSAISMDDGRSLWGFKIQPDNEGMIYYQMLDEWNKKCALMD